jgi:hypothetical protein
MAESKPEFSPPADIAASAAWSRLDGQQRYYSSNASGAQQKYRRIKLLLIVISAAIPILAFAPLPGDLPKFIVGVAGVTIAVLEGLLLLNRYGENSVTYRRTSEGLKRERALLLAGAGDYRGLGTDDALRLLAERTEALVAEENRQWVETQLKTLEALAKTKEFAREQAAAGAG